MNNELKQQITQAINQATDKVQLINEIKTFIHHNGPLNSQPVDNVIWVPIDMVQPNDYNPNSVASVEMKLLHTSIKQDGYTQPVVTIWDDNKKKYIIIDGFHRYFTCKNNKDIFERNHGLLPITVLKKDINERMASTVRHNRARGKHSVAGMSNMVFKMLENGWADHQICNELGMEPEELLKLKHVTGFSKLFENHQYRKAWKDKNQIMLEKEYKNANNIAPGEDLP